MTFFKNLGLGLLVFFPIALWLGLAFYLYDTKGYLSYENYTVDFLGPVGDFFNIATSAASIITVFLVFIAYIAQVREFRKISGAMDKQKESDEREERANRAIKIIDNYLDSRKNFRRTDRINYDDRENLLQSLLKITLPYDKYINLYVDLNIIKGFIERFNIIEDIDKGIELLDKDITHDSNLFKKSIEEIKIIKIKEPLTDEDKKRLRNLERYTRDHIYNEDFQKRIKNGLMEQKTKISNYVIKP